MTFMLKCDCTRAASKNLNGKIGNTEKITAKQ